ncbi:MAG TPA: OmpH family outer membrane protein [Candidatus Binataceae bacterium]|jgi:outer membrane protein|nr:OmpH family outer membrane protein [Candidatus Binataceae bacterium]
MRKGLILGVVLLFVAAAIPAQAEVKLAYVDIQRALNECQAGKKARTSIRADAERAQAKLQKEQATVQALKDELDKKGMLMPPDQRQNLQDELGRKMRSFQDDVKNEREELRQKDNEVTGAIVRDLATVVRQLGEKNGYTMVMEKNGLLWGIPSADITDEVIRTYDAMNVKAGSLAADPRWEGAGAAATGSKGAEGGGSSIRKHSSISK